MAEGWARYLHPDTVQAYSAGALPSQVNPLAIRVMAEVGVDLSTQHSKHLNEFLGQRFDYVVTLCSDARDNCPFFPGAANTVHVGFPDPAHAKGLPEDVLAEFRRVRDMIHSFVAEIPESLRNANTQEVE
jgi:arsenate reductase